MRGELKRLHRELRITTVYVTHDQSEAMSLSDRIAVIHQGNIQQCGAPSEVYSKPANTFVAAFIGSLPINLIQAAVRRREPPEIDCNGTILAPQMESLPEGERVIVGIRPEDITVSSEMAEGSVEVSVSLVEPAGHCDWIDFLWNGAKCKGSARPDSGIRPGAKAYMAFQEEKAVIFDESGGRV